jgi:hypothetical protein
MFLKSPPLNRLRLVLLVLGITSASASALAIAPTASAEKNYSCESCATVSGPNENPLNYNHVINYSGDGICALFWEYKGGSSYRLVEKSCTKSPTTEYEAFNLFPCSNYNAHGEAQRYYEHNYHMAGNQKWICE